jgi:hypothetical protein
LMVGDFWRWPYGRIVAEVTLPDSRVISIDSRKLGSCCQIWTNSASTSGEMTSVLTWLIVSGATMSSGFSSSNSLSS